MTARRAVAVLSVLLILLQTCTGFTEDKNYAADGDGERSLLGNQPED